MPSTTAHIRITSIFVAMLATLHIAGTWAHAQETNILTRAADAGAFHTLIRAAAAAGLEDTLAGDGPFTMFAPTDEAFAKLPEGTMDALLEDTETLKSILTYHMIPGRKIATEVAGYSHLETISGATLDVDVREGVVYIGGVEVVHVNIDAGNGVIHVIDTVISLPAEEPNAARALVSSSSYR